MPGNAHRRGSEIIEPHACNCRSALWPNVRAGNKGANTRLQAQPNVSDLLTQRSLIYGHIQRVLKIRAITQPAAVFLG